MLMLLFTCRARQRCADLAGQLGAEVKGHTRGEGRSVRESELREREEETEMSEEALGRLEEEVCRETLLLHTHTHSLSLSLSLSLSPSFS